MRALYVPVRLAAAVLAVAATAGCMSVGDDAGRPGPSHSADRRADGVPGDGSAVVGGEVGSYSGKSGKGGKGRRHGKASAKPGESASGDASASPGAKPSAKATEKDGAPSKASTPPGGEPTPPRTSAEPSPEPPPASPPSPPDPGTPEPSSSAHEQPVTQLIQREPAPEAGSPV
ncbi:hypothetical protein ACFWJM_39220 [Streptomyces sp. NPDC127077]|uniref:hypothetical protein n=1 Tax=Streptomyces sp. NPDC127077 TaxID=3347131 RepID=UPI00364F5730